MSGFQSSVNLYNPPAVAGDFATNNPRRFYPTTGDALVTGSNGATVARFGWVTSGATVDNTGSGVPDGIIPRSQGEALITTYLGESSNLIPAGFAVDLAQSGDLWMTATVAGATVGQKAFAKLSDGTMQPANAGATVSGFIETAFTIRSACDTGELCIISL